jgi:hypothetical protein
MTDFNYNTNYKLDPSILGGGYSSFGSGWNPPSDAYNSEIGKDWGTWQKGFNLKGDDPFGLNKDKKESPWGDVTRFAKDVWSSSAQNKSGQSGGPSGFFTDGGNGVTQAGDLTIVRNPPPYVQETPKSGLGGDLGGILGTVAGIALAPVTGGASLALGPGIGRFAGEAFS